MKYSEGEDRENGMNSQIKKPTGSQDRYEDLGKTEEQQEKKKKIYVGIYIYIFIYIYKYICIYIFQKEKQWILTILKFSLK